MSGSGNHPRNRPSSFNYGDETDIARYFTKIPSYLDTSLYPVIISFASALVLELADRHG